MPIALIVVLALVALAAVWYRQHLEHLKQKAREQEAWAIRVATFATRRQQHHSPPAA